MKKIISSIIGITLFIGIASIDSYAQSLDNVLDLYDEQPLTGRWINEESKQTWNLYYDGRLIIDGEVYRWTFDPEELPIISDEENENENEIEM